MFYSLFVHTIILNNVFDNKYSIQFLDCDVNGGIEMNKQKNILLAFVLNLLFSVFELVGGVFTGCVAILSDAVHDVGDAVGIGISYFCERISRNKPDDIYTFGYIRY